MFPNIESTWIGKKPAPWGCPLRAIHNTISAAFGSAYVNDFIQSGRVKRVFVQADAPYRRLPSDLEKLYVRNTSGQMVPFASFASGHWTSGSPKLERFNGFPSINIWGEAMHGKSSGEAMQAMEDAVEKLPPAFGFDWTGLSYQERMSGSQAPLLYAFSILVIFLCLAALYESWPIPISILMTLPLGAIGGIIATTLMGFPNDVYFQIGLLTILGLTTKNAILIVQFARARVDEGMQTDRCDAGRGQIAAAPHCDDFPGLRLRCTSIGFGQRGGGGGSTGHRNRCGGRCGDLHLPGDPVCAALLCTDLSGARPASQARPGRPGRENHIRKSMTCIETCYF